MHYIFDGHNDVRMLLYDNASVRSSFRYSAYGEMLDFTGVITDGYYYTGEYMDSETGLYYLGARYMNPATASFTTMDSYAGNIYDPTSLHRYLYANANPVKYCDPSGRSADLESLTTAVSQLSMLQVGKIIGVMSLMSGLLNAGMTAAFSVFSNQPIDGRDIVESFIKGFAVGGVIGTLSITVAFAMHATLLQMYIAMAGASAVQSAIDGAIAAYKGDGVGAVLNAAFSILSAISFSKLYNIN